MNKPHKHCEIIKAWADGYPIQVKVNSEWLDIDCPHFYDAEEYRIKPRTVKREGWVNITSYQSVFDSKEDAEAQKFAGCVATVKVEWEEEE